MALRSQEKLWDVVVVGAGFAGIYLLHRMRQIGLKCTVLEAGHGLGGTWYWNQYPGARCDVQSLEYSYSFSDSLEQDWVWTERYAGQPEILAYANHVADRFDLRKDIQFDTKVVRLDYDEQGSGWTVTTDKTIQLITKFVIMAVGCLSTPNIPKIHGLKDFEGEWYHTGLWPHHDVDFTDKHVGVIGTGSSAVQAIPVIAQQAKHLTVFQRTANYSIPAWNGPLDTDTAKQWKKNTKVLRDTARRSNSGILEMDSDRSGAELSASEQIKQIQKRWNHGGLNLWNTFTDIMTDVTTNEIVASFVRDKIREKVNSPETAELLCPYTHPIGSKRLCVDTNYYETFNLENVSLIDIRTDPIERITAQGIQTSKTNYELDLIVFATGFDAMTGSMLKVEIQGRAQKTLAQKWSNYPQMYLGIAMSDFPNLFVITGPGSPSVMSHVLLAIEQHVDWITDCITYMKQNGFNTIEASPMDEKNWVEHVKEVSDDTLYVQANSWYMGANIDGKTKVFMPYIGGFANYREICDRVATDGYEGFTFG